MVVQNITQEIQKIKVDTNETNYKMNLTILNVINKYIKNILTNKEFYNNDDEEDDDDFFIEKKHTKLYNSDSEDSESFFETGSSRIIRMNDDDEDISFSKLRSLGVVNILEGEDYDDFVDDINNYYNDDNEYKFNKKSKKIFSIENNDGKHEIEEQWKKEFNKNIIDEDFENDIKNSIVTECQEKEYNGLQINNDNQKENIKQNNKQKINIISKFSNLDIIKKIDSSKYM